MTCPDCKREHGAKAIGRATAQGARAWRRATSSPYTGWCRTLDAAFDRGYAQAKSARK